MRGIWLDKRLYEGLPFVYMAVGAVMLAAAVYLGEGTLSMVLALIGLAWVTGGLVVLLKRRDYRSSRSRTAFDDS